MEVYLFRSYQHYVIWSSVKFYVGHITGIRSYDFIREQPMTIFQISSLFSNVTFGHTNHPITF